MKNKILEENIKDIKEKIRTPTKRRNTHKIYVFDLETGGLNPYTDGVCSIAIKELDSKETDCFIIKPQRKLYSQEAFNVNGFNLKYLVKNGFEIERVLNLLLKKMGDSCSIIGHNIEFDLKFLLQMAREERKVLPIIHSIDTMSMAKRLLTKATKTKRGDVENYKLTTIYNYFFNDFEEVKAHTADYDVMMTEKIYKKLLALEK